MKELTFVRQIKKDLDDNKYKEVLKCIETYLESPKNAVFDSLLDSYIKCQIKLGLFEESQKNMDIMLKIFPNFFNERNFSLIHRLASCRYFEKLEELLEIITLSPDKYYIIAKICYLGQNDTLAKKLFNLVVQSQDESLAKKAKRYLEEINMYEQNPNNIFHPQTIECFEHSGQTLLPGYIIYVDRVRDGYEENRYNQDDQKRMHPYMIWQIEGDKIYAFPVSITMDKYQYIFKSEDYSYFYPDRRLKDTLVCLNKRDATSVYGKITDEDYKLAISLMYKNIYFAQKGQIKPNSKYFMETMLKNEIASLGDVIVIYDFETHTERHFYVFAIDEKNQKYKTIEIDTSLSPVEEDFTEVLFDKSQLIQNVIHIDDEKQKKQLASIIPHKKIITGFKKNSVTKKYIKRKN